MKAIACKLCSGKSTIWNSKNGYKIYKCSGCGFGFVHPELTLKEIEEIYATSGHGEKFQENTLEQVIKGEQIYPNSTIDSKRLATAARHYHSIGNKKALDVGAGYGFYTKELELQGFQVTPIELADNEKNILQQMTGKTPVNATFEGFRSDNTYGLILMSQILEHAANPIQWATKAYELLDKGGLWIIAVPHFNSFTRRILQNKEFYIIPPEHLNYFTIKSIRNLLKTAGFTVIKEETVSRLPWHKTKIPGIQYFGNPALKLMDYMNLGMMLNVVAKKD